MRFLNRRLRMMGYRAWSQLQIMAGIGAIERLVAQGKVRNDVALDGRFQSGHRNHDGSRKWQRSMRPPGPMRTYPRMSPRNPSIRAEPSTLAAGAATTGKRNGPPGSEASAASSQPTLC